MYGGMLHAVCFGMRPTSCCDSDILELKNRGDVTVETHVAIAGIAVFLIQYLLILGTNKLFGWPLQLCRSALAAGIGSVYAVGCMLPGYWHLGKPHWWMLCYLTMAAMAFGIGRRALLSTVVFLVINLSLTCLALGIGKGGTWSLLSCLAVSICGWALSFMERKRKGLIPLTVTYGGKTVCLTALMDTGNALRDPISGKRVIVVDQDVAMELLGLGRQALELPLQTLEAEKIPGLRLIPYHSIGCPSGMLLGLKMDEVKIGGETVDQIIAFAPQRIGSGKGFEALAGGAQ